MGGEVRHRHSGTADSVASVVRAVVSGITGIVGQELARQLLAAGVEVHGVSRARGAYRSFEGSDVRIHHIDGRTETLIAMFEDVRPDIVFHLAGIARREHLSSDVTPFINANILFGTQLLEACKVSGCRRFVTAGSYLQYGENGEYRPFNLYAATKQAYEDILAFYVDAYGISVVIVALCNVYTENDPRPTLLTDIAAAVTKGTPLHLHAGESWIDLVHVEDVAAALLKVLQSDDVFTGTPAQYSVTSGRQMSSGELIALFEKIEERPITIKRADRRHPARRVKPWLGNSVPGWTPRVKLEDGIKRLLRRSRERG